MFRPLLAILVLSACTGADPRTRPEPDPEPGPGPPVTPGETLPEPPWAAPPLRAEQVSPPVLAEWREAENREDCAPLAPTSLGEGEGATARAARFGGGWGVAWDLPQLRSAFGVAGTGVLASEPSYDEWPHTLRWSDGSTAGWGPEGGTGPNLLAYLRIQGQRCLYNVWSRLGGEHLEHLLGHLRFVETPAPGGR